MIGWLMKLGPVASVVGKVGALSGLQKYLLAGGAVFVLSLSGFAYWQYNAAQTARENAALARASLESANETIGVLERQREEDIAALDRLQDDLSATRDELTRAMDAIDDLRGEDIGQIIKNDPDAAARLINERAERLFRGLACETGSRADCTDSAAGPDAPK